MNIACSKRNLSDWNRTKNRALRPSMARRKRTRDCCFFSQTLRVIIVSHSTGRDMVGHDTMYSGLGYLMVKRCLVFGYQSYNPILIAQVMP